MGKYVGELMDLLVKNEIIFMQKLLKGTEVCCTKEKQETRRYLVAVFKLTITTVFINKQL